MIITTTDLLDLHNTVLNAYIDYLKIEAGFEDSVARALERDLASALVHINSAMKLKANELIVLPTEE